MSCAGSASCILHCTGKILLAKCAKPAGLQAAYSSLRSHCGAFLFYSVPLARGTCRDREQRQAEAL